MFEPQKTAKSPFFRPEVLALGRCQGLFDSFVAHVLTDTNGSEVREKIGKV